MTKGSQSSIIHCPVKDCGKILISQIALAEGTTFVIKCCSCGNFTRIIVGFNYVEKRLLQDLHKRNIITKEGDQ